MGWMAPTRHLSAKLLSDRISSEWEPSMGQVTTIGLDLAKQVFQVHGVDAKGATVLRKQGAVGRAAYHSPNGLCRREVPWARAFARGDRFWLCECASPRGELLCTDLLRGLPTGFSTPRKLPF
jgi:hypothetical protein